MRTSGKTNSTPDQPNLYRAGLGGGEKTHKKRSQNWARGLFSLRQKRWHAAMPRGCIFLYFLNKIELKHGAAALVHPRAITLVVQGL